jgi:myo-inositol-1-phosphate synthase
MGNNRTSYFWVEGSGFLDSGITVDIYLRSSDGANAGNILFDVLRATYFERKQYRSKAVEDIRAYGFKSPAKKEHYADAYRDFVATFAR